MVPFLCLLAASCVTHWLGKAREVQSAVWRWCAILVILGVAMAGLAQATLRTWSDGCALVGNDGRAAACRWINASLPPGTHLAVESYSAFPDTTRFVVQGFDRLLDHDPDWYVEHGYQYVVFGQWMYGRFYNEPERFKTEVAKYESLFARFPLVRSFTGGNCEVRVCRVTARASHE